MKPQDLQKTKETLASLEKQYAQSKGYISAEQMSEEEMKKRKMMEDQDMMFQMMKSMRSYIGYIEENMYAYMSEHNKGHLPAIGGPGQMQHCLSVLGLDKDYEVYKRPIFASQRPKEFTAEYKKTK